MPSTAEGTTLADRVRSAYEHNDLDALAELLDPAVRWGMPGDPIPPCRSRQDVIAWYTRSLAGGLKGKVTSLREIDNRLVIGLVVERSGEPSIARWQVLTTNGEHVTEITGCDNEAQALRMARTGVVDLGHAPPGFAAPSTLGKGGTLVRVPKPSDAAALLEHTSVEDGLADGWLPVPAHVSAADCANLISDWMQAWEGKPSFNGAALLIVADDDVVGYIGLDHRDGVVDLTYGIAPGARGRGHASRALTAIVEWLLTQPSVTAAQAIIASDAVASQKVARAAGLEEVGVVEQWVSATGETLSDLRFVRAKRLSRR